MAIREVAQNGQELLRKVAKKVTVFDDRLDDLLDDMWETMVLNHGMGLAAPQVSVLKRVIICDVNNLKLELINPEIVKHEGSDFEEEGCLSCKGLKGMVERPSSVTVKAQDRFGFNFTITAEKWLARCLCHEIDHLNGVLFIDKVIDSVVEE